MDVKEAAKLAKEYVADLFAEEGIDNVGLEEIELGDDRQFWEVMVGFSRPWDRGGLMRRSSENTPPTEARGPLGAR